MKKLFRICAIVLVIVMALTSFVACGNGGASASDAEGEWEGISWSYKKESKTLTISGGGDIPSADDSLSVPWKDVRGSVEKLRFSTTEDVPFTSIGDYAFYGMNKLTEVEIPKGVTSIGKCAFAYSRVLDDLTLPATLVTIGESAFEGCFALMSVEVPVNVTTLGARAFAYCKSLDIITFAGKVSEIEKWTFKDCEKLSSMRMDKLDVSFADDAFEGAGISADDIKSLNTAVVSVVCKDAEGNKIYSDPSVKTLEQNEPFTVNAPEVDGYTVDGVSSVDVVGGSEPIEVEFSYVKNAEEDATEEATDASTEAPAADGTDGEEDKNQLANVIAVIIFIVVIVGIAVGAFLFARSNKKTSKDSRTVRKNKDEKYNKNEKNKKK